MRINNFDGFILFIRKKSNCFLKPFRIYSNINERKNRILKQQFIIMIMLLTLIIFDKAFDNTIAVIFAIIKRIIPITQCNTVLKPNLSFSIAINVSHIKASFKISKFAQSNLTVFFSRAILAAENKPSLYLIRNP